MWSLSQTVHHEGLPHSAHAYTHGRETLPLSHMSQTVHPTYVPCSSHEDAWGGVDKYKEFPIHQGLKYVCVCVCWFWYRFAANLLCCVCVDLRRSYEGPSSSSNSYGDSRRNLGDCSDFISFSFLLYWVSLGYYDSISQLSYP